MKYLFITATIILVASRAVADERQLYRLLDDSRPFRGHLMVPANGASPSENFETCEGTKIQVNIEEIEQERGECGNSNHGTFAANYEELIGSRVYDINQNLLGHIASYTKNEKNGQAYIELKGYGDPKNAQIIVDTKKLDTTKTADGTVQSILLYNENEIKNFIRQK